MIFMIFQGGDGELVVQRQALRLEEQRDVPVALLRVVLLHVEPLLQHAHLGARYISFPSNAGVEGPLERYPTCLIIVDSYMCVISLRNDRSNTRLLPHGA